MVEIFFYEVKKSLFHQNGWLIVLLFCTISIAITVKTSSPTDIEQAAAPEQYNYYLNNVHGELTPKKEEYLLETAEEITNAKIQYKRLQDAYYSQEISEDEFISNTRPLEQILKNEQGFNAIYSQYRYIHENPSNRYFIPTNGWSMLFSSNIASIVIICSFLIAFNISVYCAEYRCQMDQIVLVTAKGSMSFNCQKLVVSTIFAIFAVIWQESVNLVIASYKYGLSDVDAPLQSIPAFASCCKDLSIREAWILCFVSRLLGALLLLYTVLTIETFAKDYTPSIFSAFIIGVFPIFSVSKEIQYDFPFPTTYLQAVGFLEGTIAMQNDLQEYITVFKEKTTLQIVFLFVCGAALILLEMYIIKQKVNNAWLKHIDKTIQMVDFK